MKIHEPLKQQHIFEILQKGYLLRGNNIPLNAAAQAYKFPQIR